MSAARRPPASTFALVAGFFALATVAMTWPIAPRLTNGLSDFWDAKLEAWILRWDFHQTFRDPLHLFDANTFHPVRGALAFSENLYGIALFGFPLDAAGVSAVAEYNALFLLGMFASALSAWALARDVTGDAAAALVAGLVYAFVPWRFAQIAHIQFQWAAFLPLLLLFLLRYLRDGRRRDLAGFGLCLAWNALCNVHYALYSIFLVGTALLFEAVAGSRDSRRRIPAAILAAALAVVAVVPWFAPYGRVSRLYGMQRSEHEAEWYSGRVTELLSAGFLNRTYGAATRRWSHPEGDWFPGIVPAVLAVVAIRRGRRKVSGERDGSPARPAPRTARALDAAVVFWLTLWIAAVAVPNLRVGPVRLGDPSRLLVFATAAALARLVVAFPTRSRYRDLRDFLTRGPLPGRTALFSAIGIVGFVAALGMHTPYYAFLFHAFGSVFRAIRSPSRAIVLFHMALAVLAAQGLSLLARRGRARAAAIVLSLLLVGLEYRAAPLRIWPTDPAPRPVDRWLASASFRGGVLELPVGLDFDPEYELRSAHHWKPLVNGASGFAPPRHERLAALLESDPIPDAVWPLAAELDTAVVVFHAGGTPPETTARYRKLVERGTSEGRLRPLQTFPHVDHEDAVFALER